MDHVARPLHVLLAEEEGKIWFERICLKLDQFKRITWWCLSVLEFIMKSDLESALQLIMLKKY
jgi:hypothetical protein